MSLLCFFFIIITVNKAFSQNPVTLSQAVFNGSSCLSSRGTAKKAMLEAEIAARINDTIIPLLNTRHPCTCGGSEDEWTRIAFLNMSDPTQNCPSSWNPISSPVRGCGRFSRNCDSAIFSVNNQSYSHVCGRVIAYQKGSPDAFNNFIFHNYGLEAHYIDGVSLTHGPVHSRQHIWSFAAALYERNPAEYYFPAVCPCTNTDYTWPYEVPSYVGNNYFCDAGYDGPWWNLDRVYVDDPLWDGEGCGPTHACCTFNKPPWFCRTLPQPTTDDIEMRICGDQPLSDEDIIVSLVDISIS